MPRHRSRMHAMAVIYRRLPRPLSFLCTQGWIGFVETCAPEIIPHVSSCKSPHMMVGAVLKTYFAEASAAAGYFAVLGPCAKKSRVPVEASILCVLPCALLCVWSWEQRCVQRCIRLRRGASRFSSGLSRLQERIVLLFCGANGAGAAPAPPGVRCWLTQPPPAARPAALPQKIHKKPSELSVVSVMPCVRKQGEADRMMFHTPEGSARWVGVQVWVGWRGGGGGALGPGA